MKLCSHLLTTKWNSLVWYGYEVWIAHDALCVYKEKCEWTLPWMLACGFIKILFVKAIIGSDSRPSSVTITLPALSLRPHSNHQSSSHAFSHTLIRSWIQILLPLKSPPRGPVVRKNEKSSQSKLCRSVTLSYCEWIELFFLIIWNFRSWSYLPFSKNFKLIKSSLKAKHKVSNYYLATLFLISHRRTGHTMSGLL